MTLCALSASLSPVWAPLPSAIDLYTVLMAACTASASEDKIAKCAELLLTRNADPNAPNKCVRVCVCVHVCVYVFAYLLKI